MINPSGKQLISFEQVLRQAGIKSRMTVADLGAGSGFFTFEAARLVGEDGQVYAVDILKTVIEKLGKEAKSKGYPQIKPVWSNLEIYGAAKAIANSSVDLAILSNTLHQNPKEKQQAILKEAIRMLKKGGRLLVIEWLPDKKSPFGPAKETRITPEVVINNALSVGLRQDKKFFPGPYHYALVLRKKS